ncbi:sensor histidine kinase [Nocardioides ungokensis]|uniref:sensor histidine kinase n=1 Tax=Nocardioides ungokensis TaxID=1643322 RepID=UPI001FE7353B|nr:ATP-binding protein [Nocardioides ungokensis]
MLTTVASDSDRLSRLIAELLDVARIDTGRLQLYPRPVDAGVLVTRVAESVRASTSRPIELDVAADLPEISVDPDKFTQVVTNVVENAVRHGDGTVRVSAQAVGTDDADRGVRLVVDDEGSGIPPEMRRRVFTKFWKEGARGGRAWVSTSSTGWSAPTAAPSPSTRPPAVGPAGAHVAQ